MIICHKSICFKSIKTRNFDIIKWWANRQSWVISVAIHISITVNNDISTNSNGHIISAVSGQIPTYSFATGWLYRNCYWLFSWPKCSSCNAFCMFQPWWVVKLKNIYNDFWNSFFTRFNRRHYPNINGIFRKDFQSRFVQKFERIVRLIDTPQRTIQGFAVDFSCNNTDKIFHHEDHGIIFKDYNVWLFIDNDLNRDNYESRVSFEFNQFMMGISGANPNWISDSVWGKFQKPQRFT